ncbi:MAG: glycine betaine ABC transporter substrate-binding protein [Bryobacteraceae bacterium]|jgi:osmoprotectant transport system substrate-binding protein
MDRTKIFGLIIAGIALVSTGCGNSKKPITVGSKNFTEQVILGEIIAQHLEHRLNRPVARRLNLGGTLLSYGALVNGEISLYPEYTGTIEAEILKEQAAPDAAMVFERSRLEMARTAQMELLNPLGIDNTFVMVVRSADARKYNLHTLSDAAKVTDGWKLGVGYEFEQRIDGMPALENYHLPMGAPIRSMDLGLLYKALDQGQVTMIAANATDGPLAAHDWTTLEDDKKVFGSYQACVMVRQSLLAAEPQLKPALDELSGKFTNEIMRKLDADVDVNHRRVSDVAAEFLTRAGLK